MKNNLTNFRSEESRISDILTHPERRFISFVNLNDDHCGLGQTILDVLLNSISGRSRMVENFI